MCRRTFTPSRNERDYELALFDWSFVRSFARVGLILLAYVDSSLFIGRKASSWVRLHDLEHSQFTVIYAIFRRMIVIVQTIQGNLQDS